VNASSYSAQTPLTQAVEDGLTDIVNLLLEAGADPNIPNQASISLSSSP
jgi:ankyrin repeat protein